MICGRTDNIRHNFSRKLNYMLIKAALIADLYIKDIIGQGN